jgi:hypothetical protein
MYQTVANYIPKIDRFTTVFALSIDLHNLTFSSYLEEFLDDVEALGPASCQTVGGKPGAD